MQTETIFHGRFDCQVARRRSGAYCPLEVIRGAGTGSSLVVLMIGADGRQREMLCLQLEYLPVRSSPGLRQS
jgi:hypothetical protein